MSGAYLIVPKYEEMKFRSELELNESMSMYLATGRDQEVQQVQKDYEFVGDNFAKYNDVSACSCVNCTCGCCYHVEVQKIYLNDTACIQLSYLPDEYGLQLSLTLNGRVVFNRKISVKNPPPVCGGIPYVHKFASLCLQLYELSIENKHFSGCVKLEVEFEGAIIKDFPMGCFQIPPSRKIQGN